MKRKYGIIFCILIIVLLIFVLPIQRQTEESYICQVLDQHDETYSDQVAVTLTGTYYDYLIRKDKFVGKIALEGYDFMSRESSDITFSVGNYEGSWIHEYIATATYLDVNWLGTFYACEDFDSFFLWLMVPDEKDPTISHGRYFLTYPEMTLKEIYEILQ